MGLNTTGQADVNNYRLGRGALYLASLANGLPDAAGWRFLGNCSEFNVSSETETIEHTSSQEGLKTVDAEAIVSQKMTLGLSLDEVDDQNLSLFFSGSIASHVNSHNTTTITTKQLSATYSVARWYDLIDAGGERIYDIQGTPTVRIDAGGAGGGPVLIALDTDYLLDRKMGRIFIVRNATTEAEEGRVLDFSLTASGSAVATVQEVQALLSTAVTGALKFVGVNAKTGKEQEFHFHQVSLKPEGDFAMIGEEWTTVQLTGSVEKNETADSDSPYVTIRDHANS